MKDTEDALEFKPTNHEVLSNVFPRVSSIPELDQYQWNKQTFTTGDALFKPGQPCNRFMLLGKGVVRVELRNPHDRAMTLYRIEPGQLCIHSLINLINNEDYVFIAVAETDGWFCWAEKEKFQQWMKLSSEFQQWIFHNIGSRFKQVVDRFALHAFVSVEARLAGMLIERMGPDQTIEITQSNLASELGTAREIVSRYLSRWQSEGVLETSRGVITIHNIQKLVDIAV